MDHSSLKPGIASCPLAEGEKQRFHLRWMYVPEPGASAGEFSGRTVFQIGPGLGSNELLAGRLR